MQWQWDGRWTPEKGQDATYPRFSINATDRTRTSDFWLRDASYLRLKSLEVGYRFNGGLLNSFGSEYLRVYVSGYNLLTFSELMQDTSLDPEANAYAFGDGAYPIMKVYNVGVKLGF